MSKSSEREGQKNPSRGIVILCVVMAAVVVALVVALCVVIIGNKNRAAEVPASAGGNLVVDESNLIDIEDRLAESVDDGMFEVNMNTTWHFTDGNLVSDNAYVVNGYANHYPVTIEVTLGEEVLFSSTLIPVGNQLKEVTLNRELEKGTYDAVCTYRLWNEDGEENSSFGVNVILSIE